MATKKRLLPSVDGIPGDYRRGSSNCNVPKRAKVLCWFRETGVAGRQGRIFADQSVHSSLCVDSPMKLESRTSLHLVCLPGNC